MIRVTAMDADSALAQLCAIADTPQYVVSPRGSEIREELIALVSVSLPRDRVITNAHRGFNTGFAVGEFLWYWRGSNSLEEILYYNRRMGAFSDDGETLNSAYGYIMRGMSTYSPNSDLPDLRPNAECFFDQWQNAVETLLDDPDSRRCVVNVHAPTHQEWAASGSNDVPCTLALQFFIRGGSLHLHVTMRSNDVMWGFTNDLFSFTLYQEMMLNELRLRDPERFGYLGLGAYHHTAGSMHVYERHYEQARRIRGAWQSSSLVSETLDLSHMGPRAAFDDLTKLVDFEHDSRTRPGHVIDVSLLETDGGRWMAEQLNAHRRKRDEEAEA